MEVSVHTSWPLLLRVGLCRTQALEEAMSCDLLGLELEGDEASPGGSTEVGREIFDAALEEYLPRRASSRRTDRPLVWRTLFFRVGRKRGGR